MRTDPNTWKQLMFIIIGGIVGTTCYLISRTHAIQDIITTVKFNFDIYSMHIFTRIVVFVFLMGLTLVLVMHLVWKLRFRVYDEKFLSEREYKRMMKRTTERELAKLKRSIEYKKMLEEKGNDPGKWNWQTAERLEREEKYAQDKKIQYEDSELE